MAQTLLHYALGFYVITLVPFYLAYPARSKARVIIEFLFDRVRG
jgi:hypothetical protein